MSGRLDNTLLIVVMTDNQEIKKVSAKIEKTFCLVDISLIKLKYEQKKKSEHGANVVL